VLRSSAALLILAVVAAAAAAPPLIVPGEGLPEAVVALGPLERVEAFCISADGATALAAFPSARGARRSVLRIGHLESNPAEIELGGAVLDLVVTAPGDVAFAIVRETDKKGVSRRVSLLQIDPRAARTAGSVALPATAHGLAFGPGELSLLVAAKDEIRSFLLPDLTSGPLYRLAGDNVAIAPLSGTTRALVGQGARIALVDLAAPQDRDGLPVLAATEAAAPVRTLDSAPDEPIAIALLADGSSALVETDPLRLVPRPPALAIAWPGTKAVPPSEPVAPAPAATAAPPPAAVAPPPAVPPITGAPPPAAAVPPTEPVAEPFVEAEPPEPVAESSGEPGTVTGVVAGPARADVREVVLLGPDNVLKEAARVAPDGSGRFTVSGLMTGSYRIVAAGQGGRVLVCNPPFVTVKVRPGAVLEAPALDVLRAY
jgi:hypothetical protein